MIIFSIDPGTSESAFLIWNNIEEKIYDKGIIPNIDLLEKLENYSKDKNIDCQVVIEFISSYGMPVGKETFETLFWIGQFSHAWKNKNPAVLIFRKDVKLHHCQTLKAKDANIRQALIDRFGEPGTKKNKGKLYGITSDMWSALAIATYYGDLHKE